MVLKKEFLVSFIGFLMVILDLSLISSFVKITLTLLGIEESIIKLRSLISFVPVGNVYPLVDPTLNFMSNRSTILS